MPSTIRWIGNAQAVKQVDTITIALTWAAADTVTVTINGKTVVFTAAGSTVADICTGLAAALAAAVEPEFQEITYTSTATTVLLTANTAGYPFVATSTESTAGSGTATLAHTTVCTGPSYVDNTANWSGGVVPATGDTVYLDYGSTPLLYALSTLSAQTLAALYIKGSFTGTIGLPKANPNGYVEYRGDYLQVGATLCQVGEGAGAGSGRIKIDFGAVQTAIEVYGTAGALDANLEAFIWKGTSVSNTLETKGGTTGVAVYGGETSAIATIRAAAGTLRLGLGVSTLTTINVGTADLTLSSNFGTLNTYDRGTVTIQGTATATALNVKDATVNYNSSGTATNVNILSGGTVDCSADESQRTFSNLTMSKGSSFKDPLQTVIKTNGITLASDVSTVTAA